MNKLIGQYRHAKQKVKEETIALKKAKAHVGHVEEAQVITQRIAQQVQQQAHDQIAAVVTQCLQAIFDDPYEFKITFEKKRGRTEAKLTFVRGDLEVHPMTGSGGGVVDVAAFALRLACLKLTRPRLRGVMFLDEPFTGVAEVYHERIKILLHTLAKEMNMQFVLATQIAGMQTGTVINL